MAPAAAISKPLNSITKILLTSLDAGLEWEQVCKQLIKAIAANDLDPRKLIDKLSSNTYKRGFKALLGFCFQTGIGRQSDHNAFNAYKTSAENGSTHGMMLLGLCYDNGTGCIKDPVKAFKLYERSAIGGNVYGSLCLGTSYEMGTGVQQSEPKAFWWMTKSVLMGNKGGLETLVNCYGEVFGDAAIGSVEYWQRALDWFRTRAENASRNADFFVGVIFEEGRAGQVDKKLAFEAYERAAASEPDAMNALGRCFRDSIHVKTDFAKAFQCFTKAAQVGNAHGQYNLGLCYKLGQGTRVDKELAKRWFAKAADNGLELARKEYQLLFGMI